MRTRGRELDSFKAALFYELTPRAERSWSMRRLAPFGLLRVWIWQVVHLGATSHRRSSHVVTHPPRRHSHRRGFWSEKHTQSCKSERSHDCLIVEVQISWNGKFYSVVLRSRRHIKMKNLSEFAVNTIIKRNFIDRSVEELAKSCAKDDARSRRWARSLALQSQHGPDGTQ